MSTDFSDEFDDAKVEAGKFDVDDILAFGTNYFHCGYKPKEDPDGRYYNHSIAVAFAIIGKLYCPSQKGSSNYHKGVAYIAKKLEISKRKVKVLRKKFSREGGYVFITPYQICTILEKMIELLSEKETDPMVKEYLQQRRSDLYREILIAKQYAAVMNSAKGDDNKCVNDKRDKKVNAVYGQLRDLTKKVG